MSKPKIPKPSELPHETKAKAEQKNEAKEEEAERSDGRPWWFLCHADDLATLGDGNLSSAARDFECLRGHPNFSSLLERFRIVPASLLPSDTDFVAASYRHKDASASKCGPQGATAYLTGNFDWFLTALGRGKVGWIDVLCVGPGGHSLQRAFEYMGRLYSEGEVSAEYLTHPSKWLQAEPRGWIYQESAFTSLDPDIVPAHPWATILGLFALCKLCERRGLWEHVTITGQVAANALSDRGDVVVIPIQKRAAEQGWESLGVVEAALLRVAEAANRQGFEPRPWEVVWKQVCTVAERLALSEGASVARQMEAIRDERWGRLAQRMIGMTMRSRELLPHQAPALLRAYASSAVYSEKDREPAILGLAARLLGFPGRETSRVLSWCWGQLWVGVDIAAPLKNKGTATMGAGPVYARKEAETFYEATGLVLVGSQAAGNGPGEGLLVTFCFNGEPGDPSHVQVIVMATKQNVSEQMERLDQPGENRNVCFS